MTRKLNYDFTSVYPAVMKMSPFPIGFPQVITESFDNIDNYFGLVHCKILPPKKLLFPILPTRCNNKLLFILFNVCGHLKQSNCNHSDDERAIEGTWISEEVKHAIKNGYQMIKIYNTWN